jgi:hypothetical protein
MLMQFPVQWERPRVLLGDEANGSVMQTRFDTRNDELFHAVGLFFMKWSWLEDALTYLLESVLNIDEEFGGLIHKHLSTDSKLTLIATIADRYDTQGLFEYERDAMKRLVRDIGKIKEWRNILAHEPLTDMFGSLPQMEGMGEIGALSIRVKRSGKTDVPELGLKKIKEVTDQIIHLEIFASQLARGFCAFKGRREK